MHGHTRGHSAVIVQERRPLARPRRRCVLPSQRRRGQRRACRSASPRSSARCRWIPAQRRASVARAAPARARATTTSICSARTTRASTRRSRLGEPLLANDGHERERAGGERDRAGADGRDSSRPASCPSPDRRSGRTRCCRCRPPPMWVPSNAWVAAWLAVIGDRARGAVDVHEHLRLGSRRSRSSPHRAVVNVRALSIAPARSRPCSTIIVAGVV